MTPILAEFSVMSVVMSVGAILFVVFVFAIIYASRYKKTGPNEVQIGRASCRERVYSSV